MADAGMIGIAGILATLIGPPLYDAIKLMVNRGIAVPAPQGLVVEIVGVLDWMLDLRLVGW